MVDKVYSKQLKRLESPREGKKSKNTWADWTNITAKKIK